MGFVGMFSAWPEMRVLQADEAIISVSFSLAGERVGICHQYTQEELNELPPNMRRPADCPRERHPVRVEITANDEVVYSAILPASGLWSDGESIAYQRIVVDAGDYDLRMKLDNTGNESAFLFTQSAIVDIAPGRNFVIRFDRLNSRFEFE
jgi:hypothetical protein